jgi:hypothetical protein
MFGIFDDFRGIFGARGEIYGSSREIFGALKGIAAGRRKTSERTPSRTTGVWTGKLKTGRSHKACVAALCAARKEVDG